MTDRKSLDAITVADAGTVVGRLDSELTPRLYKQPDPIYLDPATVAASEDNVARVGIVQGLQDLGYLPELATARAFSGAELGAALAQWRSETRASATRYRRGKDSADAADIDLAQPLPWLIQQTAFEQGVECLRLPKAGERSLESRLLLYRLKTFNRYEDDVGAPLPAAALASLDKLKRHAGFKDGMKRLAFLNRLGDANALCERFAKSHADQVFCYADSASTGTQAIAGVRLKSRNIWVRPSGAPYSGPPHKRPAGARRRTVREFVADKPRQDAASFSATFRSEENTLGLELLQLKLWQQGYYTGAIDADWGPFSVAALDHLLTSEDTFQSSDVLKFPVAGGYAINLQSLFTVQLPGVERLADKIRDEDVEALREQVLDAEDEEWDDLARGADKLLESEPNPSVTIAVTTRRRGDLPQATMTTRRRRRVNLVVSGFKRVLFGIWKTIARVTQKITQAISKAARAIRAAIIDAAEHVRSLFRGLLDGFRAAVRVARAALKRLYYWLAGEPFGSKAGDRMIVTKWSLDFDTVTYIAQGTDAGLLALHERRVDFLNASFRFMTRLALTVLQVLAAVATWNWLKVVRLVYVTATSLDEWDSRENPFRFPDPELANI